LAQGTVSPHGAAFAARPMRGLARKPAARDSAMIFYRHFGLSGAPFQFTPSPKVFYASPAHSNGLAALEGSLTAESAAITLLIGATGSGKTTLAMAMLARQWGRSQVVYLGHPKAGYQAILREILRQLGIAEHGSEGAMAEGFSRYLASLNTNQRILVMIDEAHYLNDAICDEIEEFLNSGRNGLERLSLALIGEPELLERVASIRHWALQELTASLVVLKPLALDEATRYAEYRLAAFEGSAVRVFAPGALEYLLKHGDGVPRRINILCHNAMLVAHAVGMARVSLEIARTSVLEFERRTLEVGVASASPNGGISTKQKPAREVSDGRGGEHPARKTTRAPHGMGIGLIILSMVVMSALWLAATRSEQGLSYNQGDVEVPAIFSDDLNGGGVGAPERSYRVEEGSAAKTGLGAIAPAVHPKADNGTLVDGIARAEPGHPEVTVGPTGADGNVSDVHGSGFGS
jgi:MSHA biogenesis protein MshM